MDKIKGALEILSKSRIRNINAINFMKDYLIEDVHIEGDSVLIKGRSDEAWCYISSESERELKVLLKNISKNDLHFAIIEDWMLPFVVKERKLEWQLSCVKLYFPDDELLPENKVSVVDLCASEAQFIYKNSKYQQFTSVDYILERIEKGIALGIYDKEKLVAWILTHDDGALGFLHVLPEYRGKGYAYEITVAGVKKLREQGKVSFVHIEEKNQASMNLCIKMGFVKDRLVHWLKIIEE